jgi:hypothetical protein
MKRALGVVGVIALTVLLLAGCSSDGNGGTNWDALFAAIALNQDHNRSIASFGTDLFKFTTAVAGSYEIRVENISASGDMDWALYDSADPAVASQIAESSAHADATPEIASVGLSGSRTYYLVADEWADPGSSVTYTLRVNSP